ETISTRKPFEGASELETLQMIMHAPPKPMDQSVPAELREAIEKALEKEAARRYPSMRELVLDLRRLGRGSGISASLDSPRSRTVSSDSQTTSQTKPGSDAAIRSIAVLPFVNGSDNPEMEYLSDGLTESIIVTLCQLPGIHVMARSAVFRFKSKTEDAQNAGRMLGVAAVLTGRVQQRGEMLLISAEFVDVETGWQLWGEQYRRPATDIFAIEEEIAREISGKLRVKIAPDQKKQIARRYTEDVEAYHLYLKGKF